MFILLNDLDMQLGAFIHQLVLLLVSIVRTFKVSNQGELHLKRLEPRGYVKHVHVEQDIVSCKFISVELFPCS
jgi:hypothetical protein